MKQLGASQSTIEAEERKLLEFEKVVFQDFRQDLLKKLKKQGAKTAVLKDKLGLGYMPAHIRYTRAYVAIPYVMCFLKQMILVFFSCKVGSL